MLLGAIVAGWAGIEGVDAPVIPGALVLVALAVATTVWPCFRQGSVLFSGNRAVFAALLTGTAVPAGTALAVSGLLAGSAFACMRDMRRGEPAPGTATTGHLLSGLVVIAVMTGLRFTTGSVISLLTATIAFVLLVLLETILASFRSGTAIGGVPAILARYLVVYLILAPVTVILTHVFLTGGPGMLAAVSVPVAAYSLVLDNRETLVAAQRRKTSELSRQNTLVRALMETDSTSDLMRLLDGYLRSGDSAGSNLILSRLQTDAGWMVWSSSDQSAIGHAELPVPPPGINELTAPCAFRDRTGAFLGLSGDSDLLLFVETDAAERLASMSRDVRNNLVLLLNRSWQVMGHHLKSEEAFLAAAVMLARLVDSKDDYTHGHSLRVADLSCALGARLGLGVEEMKTLRAGALLHDLGKIAIDSEILTKRGLLTTPERSTMERHSAEGAAIVKRLRDYDEVAEIILCHHEKLDGSGYPAGLRNREIPFLARIVTVADTFDAITSTRSYHALIDQMTALDTICEGRGSQFDARVVDALGEIISTSVLGKGEEHGA
jgi:putative nucleotidyltransferase with HDIG domain